MPENQKDNTPEQETTDRSGTSIKLVIRGNSSDGRAEGEADYILQRQLTGEPDAGTADPDAGSIEPPPETMEVQTDSTGSLSEYIASLTDYVPEDVTRVVDAIIEEENRFPTNLPTLDETLSMIFPVSDDIEDPDVEIAPFQAAPERQEEDESEEASSTGNQKYIKKVEYEDL